MKKIIILASVIVTILSVNKEQVLISPESIRFRVIANSNNKEDQKLKKAVVNNLKKNIEELNFNNKNLNQSKTIIKNNIPEFKNTIENTIKTENKSSEYKINYGNNYFPEKKYKGITYKEGNYESLVITLGDGLGDNFWCVLFPPLCLIETEDTNSSEVEYTSIIQEIINKYF